MINSMTKPTSKPQLPTEPNNQSAGSIIAAAFLAGMADSERERQPIMRQHRERELRLRQGKVGTPAPLPSQPA